MSQMMSSAMRQGTNTKENMEQINPTSEIEKSIATLTAGHELITCQTREEYEILCKQDDTAAGFEKQVAEYWDGNKEKPGPVAKAYSLWKDLTSKRKTMLDPLKAFRSAVSRVTGPYLCQEQEKARQQAAALAKQAEKAGIDTSLIPMEAPKVEAGDGRALVQTWVFEVVDEAKVPREYLVIDEVKIRKVVQALKDKTNTSGIVARMEASVRRTGR